MGSETASTDPVVLLSRALDQAGSVIARIRPEQARMPTPCSSWDVHALVNHVVDEVHQFALETRGGQRRNLGTDVVGDDWSGAYREAADSLLTAWRARAAGDGANGQSANGGPREWAVGRHITEVAVHTWDIAKATGQSTDLDPDVGRLALAWATDNVTPQLRGDEAAGAQIGHEVPVPSDASLYDRLAAFGGRDPG